MKRPIVPVEAKTHPAGYLLHKYWTRKPHNVLSHFISSLIPPNGVLVDPCCGSGVSLREAALLGAKSYGFDVNPVAALISSVTVNPPELAEFTDSVSKILEDLEPLIDKAYGVSSNTIRYTVHETVVGCACGQDVYLSVAIKEGRIYRCPKCKKRVNFNLESLKTTRVIGVVYEGDNKLCDTKSVLELQSTLSHRSFYKNTKAYNVPFVENRRILSFEGLRLSDLFTSRNFSILCALADKIHSLKDGQVKQAALMMLSASVVQCSRLIPYRNNMTTGGPAWSVPGFWVPPMHMETNPLIHFKARFSKFVRGISELRQSSLKAPVSVENVDAVTGINSLSKSGVKADLYFWDPPYGDSVPFLEFSFIWNSFLKKSPSLDSDISVSDRIPKAQSWIAYRNGLLNIAKAIKTNLKRNGQLLITFNNNDIKAWEALLAALQENNFVCEHVSFQTPPVVSAKAQFAVNSSYISDLYSVFTVGHKDTKYSRSLVPIIKALELCAKSRGGRIPRNLAYRVASIAWLENNVCFELIPEIGNIVEILFDPDGDFLTLKDMNGRSVPEIRQIAREVAVELLKNGPCSWEKIYLAIAEKTRELGIPDSGELQPILSSMLVFKGQRCYSVKTEEKYEQPLLI